VRLATRERSCAEPRPETEESIAGCPVGDRLSTRAICYRAECSLVPASPAPSRPLHSCCCGLFVRWASPQAKSACTNPNSILSATYGWLDEDGLTTDNNPPMPKVGDFVPLVHVGQITFDGNGNFSGSHDTNLGGVLIPHVDFGTYSVNSDCTTGTISFASGVGFRMSIVITSGGQEIKFVGAATSVVISGTLRLAAAAPCSASTLTGNSYGYASHGLVAAGKGNGFPRVGGFVPFSDAGQISFAADGSVSGMDSQDLGGVVIPGQPIAGSYSVNSNCTGMTTMTIAGADRSWHSVILQGGDQIIFISAPSGVVWDRYSHHQGLASFCLSCFSSGHNQTSYLTQLL
jgi:hypothetical protein